MCPEKNKWEVMCDGGMEESGTFGGSPKEIKK